MIMSELSAFVCKKTLADAILRSSQVEYLRIIRTAINNLFTRIEEGKEIALSPLSITDSNALRVCGLLSNSSITILNEELENKGFVMTFSAQKNALLLDYCLPAAAMVAQSPVPAMVAQSAEVVQSAAVAPVENVSQEVLNDISAGVEHTMGCGSCHISSELTSKYPNTCIRMLSEKLHKVATVLATLTRK